MRNGSQKGIYCPINSQQCSMNEVYMETNASTPGWDYV